MTSSTIPGWRPEYRLHGAWIPVASLAGGLVTYGLTLNFQKSWLGLAFGWVMVNLGMVGTTVFVSLCPSQVETVVLTAGEWIER